MNEKIRNRKNSENKKKKKDAKNVKRQKMSTKVQMLGSSYLV